MPRVDGERPVRLQTQDADSVLRIEGDRPVHFQNTTFNNVAGSLNVSHTTNVGESGLDILLRAVSLDAMHDSAERPPDPSCHPGTRSAILDQLDKWSFEQPSDSLILWLHGCAGIGKSAIAQQFAASCHDGGKLGGAFFFKRGSVSRGTWRNLLPTLAYQLAATFPQLGPRIQRAVETDRLVLGKAIHHQLEKLLVQPFRDVPPLASRPILVIDGLDECEDRGTQTALIRALIDVLHSGNAPLHILVCSRSEPHLRDIFEAPKSSDVCRGLEIRADDAALADIRRYLTEGFSRVQQIHTARGTLLDERWPGENTIEHLIEKSSGTFIYASTVLRCIDDEYSHPAERLDAVLSLDPSSLTPLDDLYTQILSSIPNKPTLLRVLHAVVKGNFDAEQIDSILRMRQGTSRAVLRGLHAVVLVHPARILGYPKSVELLHASFGDFLVDSQRSLSFCISGEDLLNTLVHDMACALLSGSLEPINFGRISTAFMLRFWEVPPSDGLLPLFWSVNFQHEVFAQTPRWRSTDQAQTVISWLERFSPAPLDLIRTWGKFCTLALAFQSSPDGDSPRDYPADLLHPQYFQSPDILSVLRIWNVLSERPGMLYSLDIHGILDLLLLKWDVLVPLTKVSGADSVDIKAILRFLDDPDKCGPLYMPREEIRRFAVLQWIRRLKAAVLQRNFTAFHFAHAELLDALKDLDLAQACSIFKPDTEYHLHQHEHGLVQLRYLDAILEWIRAAPSPPPDLIRSWEQQQKAVQQCYARLQSEIHPNGPLQVDSDSG
ncbi:hypothetical protein FB45DRAFT_1064662 [Roridomyces roridus]|uniref:Nephrocystin 3-like N-terminal domain-containing protein n=1 Tax=Roridomyces roridus TaxID=1738132 RepID=A0AAD7B9A5_9AGAR|nr:hypothetical protein FB45DRAFT_1064662 [Roridomyces roridus]